MDPQNNKFSMAEDIFQEGQQGMIHTGPEEAAPF